MIAPIALFFVARVVVGIEQWGNFTWPPDDTTEIPSTNPSVSPTSQTPSLSSSQISLIHYPSISPSIAPTMAPSFECHDQAKYRSPINDLNCSQHNGTDCFQWIHLGLRPFEVEELINSCPIACDIDCGALFVFETNLTLHLLELDNFLSPETTVLLEEATSEFMTKFILAKNETSRFSLNIVELLSQRRLETTGGKQNLLRSLQQTDDHHVDLEISLGFQGFFLELNLDAVESLLAEGIDTFGYMRALRFTNDPALQFVEVGLHKEDEIFPTNVTTTTMTSDEINKSRWKVFLTVFVITGIFCVFVLYIQKKNKPSADISDIEVDLPDVSPAASLVSRCALLNTFSHDRAVRFASIDELQRSMTPTSLAGSTESGLSLRTSPNNSLLSTNESIEEEEHPLTGVIPPMIVFDSIESANDQENMKEESRSRGKIKLVVPYKMVIATSTFRKALQSNSIDALDNSMFVGIQNFFQAADFSLEENGHDCRIDQYQLNAIFESGSAASVNTMRAGVRERDFLNSLESHDNPLTNNSDNI